MTLLFSGIRNLLSSAKINIILEGEDDHYRVCRPGGQRAGEELPLYSSQEPLKGIIRIESTDGKIIEFLSITCEFCGIIEVYGEQKCTKFVSRVTTFERKGQMAGCRSYPFDFSSIMKDYESYYGVNVTLRYATFFFLSHILFIHFQLPCDSED